MNLRPYRTRLLVGAVAIALVAATPGWAAPAPQAAQTAQTAQTTQAAQATRTAQAARAKPGDLANTVALSNCSASLVRFPTSRRSDRALMLTNGHCYEGGFLSAGQILRNQASTRTGTLLDAAGASVGTVQADRIIYATMDKTDVTLYRLDETYAALRARTGGTPYTIRATKPTGTERVYIPSGYWQRVWECRLQGFVHRLYEADWTWQNSLRYAKPCETIGGTSGSPVVDSKRRDLIGINNTGSVDGERCTLDNPCEVDRRGRLTVDQGRRYGQQTWWLTTCVNHARQLDLTVRGCRLPGASRH